HDMIRRDREIVDRPEILARSNKRFHRQIHLASHNRYLVAQLEMVHRSMVLLATTSLAAEGRGAQALDEHAAIVGAIETRDGAAADAAIRNHISRAFETRLMSDTQRGER
ncbi:MAG TPA: FCD domain-containing protein, partial [Amaricoccus sp.]|nr:FCD domain-containing protein [Amaricoccus sp.]